MTIHTKDIDEQIKWAKINKDVLRSLENPRMGYWVNVVVCLAMISCAVAGEIYQYRTGLGPTNLNNPHMWDLYIATF
ncbi:MAG: polysulfide reductase, partial [Gammaproteobacteria bacterium]